MTETEQLREALQQYKDGFIGAHSSFEPIMKAAQAYLSLLEQHPGIQGLIAGTHWIAPNEPTEEMLKIAGNICVGSSGEYDLNDYCTEDSSKEIYQAMRNAAKSEGK